ncbi:hypothetical protein VE01_10154 [Pseudogymnoascus verrucosus]|uniref:Uncharacterized protein n=1 Tax=Pseudogymnoascus verrucosus TaxID=342668 RepID=A0A1B8G7M3_9PEZI|nr:uncharacterized protein VE01_10154 [Pseudogymnoascus verrucosus]OBT91838.1 hypothetical protein VE01_10154 [Pseudogymnoascus verrucosus]
MPSYVVTGASKGLGYGIKNVKLYKADITDLPALKAAAADVQATVGGIGISLPTLLLCQA